MIIFWGGPLISLVPATAIPASEVATTPFLPKYSPFLDRIQFNLISAAAAV
jgi:hypothetical protein